MIELAKIARTIGRSGYLRRSTPRLAASAVHREWLHFCIKAGDLDLIVNVSAVEARGGERVRWTVLACDGGIWDGDVEDVDANLVGGHLFASFARGLVCFRDGAFRLMGCLRDRPISFDLCITPRSFPSLASNISLGSSEAINWFVVPYATADGWIEVGGERCEMRGARAYHDHNWGAFTHRNFTWQWAHASTEAASVVLARLLDRVQSTAYVQSLLVWSGPRQHRVFRGNELEVRPEGWLRPAHCLTVPRIASLLGGGPSEVPAVLHLRAAGGGDELVGAITTKSVARIAVPDDHGLGFTFIHEVVAELELAGQIRGEDFALTSSMVCELLRTT
jgi:hypothetical protein